MGSDELIEIASSLPAGGRDEKFALRLELFNSLSSSFISYRDRYDKLGLEPIYQALQFPLSLAVCKVLPVLCLWVAP
jgi:hypothetical protein